MFCTRCGKEVTDDSTFCVHCGDTLQEALSTDIRPDDRETPKDPFKLAKQIFWIVDSLLLLLGAWYHFTH